MVTRVDLRGTLVRDGDKGTKIIYPSGGNNSSQNGTISTSSKDNFVRPDGSLTPAGRSLANTDRRQRELQSEIDKYSSSVDRYKRDAKGYIGKLSAFGLQKKELQRRILKSQKGYVPAYKKHAIKVEAEFKKLTKEQKALTKREKELTKVRGSIEEKAKAFDDVNFRENLVSIRELRRKVNRIVRDLGQGHLIGKMGLVGLIDFINNTGYDSAGNPISIDRNLATLPNQIPFLDERGRLVGIQDNITGQSRLPTGPEILKFQANKLSPYIDSKKGFTYLDKLKDETEIKLKELGIYDKLSNVEKNIVKASESFSPVSSLFMSQYNKFFKDIEEIPLKLGSSPEDVKKASSLIYSNIGLPGYSPLSIVGQTPINLESLRKSDPYIVGQLFPENIVGTSKTAFELWAFSQVYGGSPTIGQIAMDVHMIDSGLSTYKNENLPEATRYIGGVQSLFGGSLLGSKINPGKIPFVRERQIIVADSGELVPLASRMSVLDAIATNNELITLTSRTNLFNNKMTNVPKVSPKHGLSPEGITYDYTYGIPIKFSTFEQAGGITPTSKIFSQKWIGKTSVDKTKVQTFEKGFLNQIKKDLLIKGKTSEGNIKKIYEDALIQAEASGEPIATLSPKLLRGFEQAELELVRVYPKNYKGDTPKFIGFTSEGSPVLSTLPLKEIIKGKISSEFKFNKKIGDYWEDIGRRKLDYLENPSSEVPGAYQQHGKAHLIDNQPWGKNDYMHDLVKIMDTDSFSQYPHGPTQAKLIKEGRYDDILGHLSKVEKIKFADGVGGHEFWRPNIKTLFIGPNGGINIPSFKQLRYSLPEWVIKNKHLQRISTLDRLDLIRFGIKPNFEFMSKSVLQDLGLVNKGQKINFEGIFKNLPKNVRDSYVKFSNLRSGKTKNLKVKQNLDMMENNYLNYLSEKYSTPSLATYGKMYYNIDKIPNISLEDSNVLKEQADRMIKEANLNSRLKTVIDFESWSPIPGALGKNLSKAEAKFLRNLFNTEYKPRGILKGEFMEIMAEKNLLQPKVKDRLLKIKSQHNEFFKKFLDEGKKSLDPYTKKYKNKYLSKYPYKSLKGKYYGGYLGKKGYSKYSPYEPYDNYVPTKSYATYSAYDSKVEGYDAPYPISPPYSTYTPYIPKEVIYPIKPSSASIPKSKVNVPIASGKVRTAYYGDPFYRITGTPRYSKGMNIDLRKLYQTGFG